mmetsp:Transcript_22335/g.39317  ORF Transcript_22335/g.39317 Transcript_22335/m.39317 type:complete len:205 (+) Transcript_22335:502-1116(+)
MVWLKCSFPSGRLPRLAASKPFCPASSSCFSRFRLCLCSACLLLYSGSACRFCSSTTSLLLEARHWFIRNLSSIRRRSRSLRGGAIAAPSSSSSALRPAREEVEVSLVLSGTGAPPSFPARMAFPWVAAFALGGATSSVSSAICRARSRVGVSCVFVRRSVSPQPTMCTATRGLSSLSVGICAMARTTSIPAMTWPKTTCLPSS